MALFTPREAVRPERRFAVHVYDGAASLWFITVEHVTIQRMDLVGIVVEDLAAATEFFVELGLELRPLVPGSRPLRCAKPCEPERLTGLWTLGDRCVAQTTSVRRRIARNTLWALCTAIPIQALRYRFVGYAVVNISSSVPGIAHGTCRW
jgi:hypothetical protein